MDTKTFEAFWEIYDEAFPRDEKRDVEGQKALLGDKDYSIYLHNENGVLLGFLAYWRLGRFHFVEHLAVSRKARGMGVGSLLVQQVLQLGKPVVLEVEPPEDETQRKRIAFYQRRGFVLNDHPHVQPPLAKGANPVALQWMSYPLPLSREEARYIEEKLNEIVYSKNKFIRYQGTSPGSIA